MVMNITCKFEKSTYNTLASRGVMRKSLHTAAAAYSCVIHSIHWMLSFGYHYAKVGIHERTEAYTQCSFVSHSQCLNSCKYRSHNQLKLGSLKTVLNAENGKKARLDYVQKGSVLHLFIY